MTCRDCPYIKDEFIKRLDPKWDIIESINEAELNSWCNKTGGLIEWYGQCEDAVNDIPSQISRSKQKKRNKRERDLKHKQRLKFLTENIQYYPVLAVYIDEIRIRGYGYVDNPKPYYKRYYRGNHGRNRYKLYKNVANKKVSRYRGELHYKGNQYRKVFDYWWTVD